MGTWAQPQTIRFGTGDDLHNWLEEMSWGGKRSYIVAFDAAEVLTVSGFWDRLTRVGCKWGKQSTSSVKGVSNLGVQQHYQVLSRVTSLRTTIVDYIRYGRRLTWLSLTQYLPMSEHEVAELVGYEWSDADGKASQGYTPDRTQNDRCLLTLRAMLFLADWWRKHKGGSWANSLGGLSFQWLRHRLQTREVCTHSHDEVLRLERHACYGGRVTCWYAGDVRPRIATGRLPADMPESCSHPPIDAPVYVVDVSSMYASLMRDHPFPVKLIGFEPTMSVSDLKALLRTCGAIATVQIVTDEAEYPYRIGDNVYYPTGRYTTVLAGAELCDSLDRGRVAHVGTVAVYQMGTPLHASASDLLTIRGDTSIRGRNFDRTFAKQLANASTGRLAQRGADWQPVPGAVPATDQNGRQIVWGGWITQRDDTDWRPELDPRYEAMGGEVSAYRPKVITRWRSIGGLVERHCRSELGTGTLQAIYAYLTAYGRSMMTGIRRGMPERSVLLQDTDGMWVTEAGYAHLLETGQLSANLPGCLRLDRTIRFARIYGPKHYYRDGTWVLSGFRDPTFQVSGQAWEYSVTSNPIRGTPTEAPTEVQEYRRRCELLLIHQHGRMGDDGWISPYVLPQPVGK